MAVAEGRQKAAIAKERKRVEARAVELASCEERVHHLADQMVRID